LNQDILPIVLCDTNVAMPRDAYWFEPYHTTVIATLPRMTPQNFDYSQGVVPLMKHCETRGAHRVAGSNSTPSTPRASCGGNQAALSLPRQIYVEQFVKWKMKLDPFFLALDAVVPRRRTCWIWVCGYGMASHWLATFTDTRTFWGVDYDEEKIRVAQRSAREVRASSSPKAICWTCGYPAGDAVLAARRAALLDGGETAAHPDQVRQALRPGGRLIFRDGARAESEAHRKVHRWEEFATRVGMNRTKEGLHFQSLAELEAMLRRQVLPAGNCKTGAGNDSNVMLVAFV
jgi:hypothetical protein